MGKTSRPSPSETRKNLMSASGSLRSDHRSVWFHAGMPELWHAHWIRVVLPLLCARRRYPAAVRRAPRAHGAVVAAARFHAVTRRSRPPDPRPHANHAGLARAPSAARANWPSFALLSQSEYASNQTIPTAVNAAAATPTTSTAIAIHIPGARSISIVVSHRAVGRRCSSPCYITETVSSCGGSCVDFHAD